jgi:ribosomal protein L7Ae-like RNA K-turn-binding protein
MAQAAGRLVSGDAACYDALQKGKLQLLILATDASPRTKRHFVDAALQLGLKYVEVACKEDLGKAIGKPDRAVVGVVDAGFARSLVLALPGPGN